MCTSHHSFLSAIPERELDIDLPDAVRPIYDNPDLGSQRPRLFAHATTRRGKD